ncbi:MAG: hypothetical protein ABUK15_07310 [Anaerolineales bacterium]
MMGIIGDTLFGKTKDTSQVALTPEQQKLTQQQVTLGEFQKEELERQRLLQEEAFGAVDPSADAFDQFVAEQDQQQSGSGDVQDELLQNQLDRIRAGGAATPEEIDLINSATEQAIAAGETDINRFLKFGLEQLRDELAPQLGLRPGDTPILDRGSRVAGEAARQQGQLVSSLRGQQFQSQLNFPLQRTQVLGGLVGGQQDMQEQIRQFQAQLKQGAFINRLQLAGGKATAGLGLAGASAPNIGPAFSAVGGVNKGTDASQGLLNLTQGFQNVAGGVGSILGSSRDWKDTQGPVDGKEILEALQSLPIDMWTYKGDDADHIGTYAEDFRDAFGVGDGKHIAVIDAIGVLMAAVKELAEARDGVRI